MPYSIQHIGNIISAEVSGPHDITIEYLITDSRRTIVPQHSIFFAISGPRRDGHQFIQEVYDRGVRCFVVKKGVAAPSPEGAVFLLVDDVLTALQKLAAFHRSKFNIPVIGITGSNGKTMVKEWLYQLLQQDYNIVRSPRSYNSQIGVPLSVWQMSEQHTLGIFEAGISTTGEMQRLADIIQPTDGIFTNILGVHNEGFANNREKAMEKTAWWRSLGRLWLPTVSRGQSEHPDCARWRAGGSFSARHRAQRVGCYCSAIRCAGCHLALYGRCTAPQRTDRAALHRPTLG